MEVAPPLPLLHVPFSLFARKNVEVFERAEVDRVMVSAAGCGAALSEYGEFLPGDGRAHAFASRVVDIAALLVREGFEPPPSALAPIRVAYDAPCHLFHAQKVKNEPREILRSIRGIELVEHHESERCCGSAGIYNVTHYAISMEVLECVFRGR